MSPARVKTTVVSVFLVTCIIVGIFGKLISPTRDCIRICGSLTPRDIAEIKCAARRQIFTETKGPDPGWLPVPVQESVWIPIKKVISDLRHPLEIIYVGTDSVQVWFRGPEQKAYVNGKEHGWFLRSVTLVNGPKWGTDSFPSRIQLP